MQMIFFWLQLWGGLCRTYIFGQLSPDFCRQMRCSFLCTSRQLCLSTFQGLIMTKSVESHSNLVPGVSSSFRVKMQSQPCLHIAKLHVQLPVCWNWLFRSAYAVRNTRHRNLAGNQQRSCELPLLLLLLFWLLSQHCEVRRKQRKRKECSKKTKNTDIETARIGFLFVPLGTKISNPEAYACYFKTFTGKFFLHSMAFVHHITRQYVPIPKKRLSQKGQTLSSVQLLIHQANQQKTLEKLSCSSFLP